jgi:hypothetical protein
MENVMGMPNFGNVAQPSVTQPPAAGGNVGRPAPLGAQTDPNYIPPAPPLPPGGLYARHIPPPPPLAPIRVPAAPVQAAIAPPPVRGWQGAAHGQAQHGQMIGANRAAAQANAPWGRVDPHQGAAAQSRVQIGSNRAPAPVHHWHTIQHHHGSQAAVQIGANRAAVQAPAQGPVTAPAQTPTPTISRHRAAH